MPGDRPEGYRVTWRESDRMLPRLVVRPLLAFMHTAPAPAAAMTLAALAAMLWANSGASHSYFTLWDTPLTLHIGAQQGSELTVRDLVNDAGMALFFLLVGVELKYETMRGSLRRPGAALLPVVAAVCGMAVPALLYLALNVGHAGERGWGIPVATDIAFAVGVISLVGARVAPAARVFLLTLAIVDDIGGIVVISLFYTSHLNGGWLLVLLATIGVVLLLRLVDVRSLAPYALLGGVAWFSLWRAGVEPAIVGVLFGLLAPTDPFHRPEEFAPAARRRTEQASELLDSGPDDVPEATAALLGLADYATLTAPVGPRLEQRLRIWVNLAVLPLFALANAGVHIGGVVLNTRIFFGTVLGLCVGKAVGIFGSTRLTAALTRTPLPAGVGTRSLLTVSTSAGMGFAVSLFIAALAFSNADLTASASLGVLTATAVSGIVSVALAVLLLPRRPPVDAQGGS